MASIAISRPERDNCITLQSKRTRERQRRELDAQVEELFTTIRDINKQRNRLAPVFLLPSELLAHIFLEAHDCAETKAHRQLPAVSQVCSDWRAVALGSGLLWTGIDCTYPLYAREVISRSAGCALDVIYDSSRRK